MSQVIRTIAISPAEVERLMPPETVAKRKELAGQIVATEKQYEPPPSYFLIRGDINSRGS